MKKADSIALLNKSVADELQAVHQYMYFHFHLSDLGFAPCFSSAPRFRKWATSNCWQRGSCS